jgi:hypothetical protein
MVLGMSQNIPPRRHSLTDARATLLALADELEGMAWPSRELDARIEDAIGPESERPGSHLLGGFSRGRADYLRTVAPRYTSSIDAAYTLLRHALPGWPVILGADGFMNSATLINPKLYDSAKTVAASLPLALCAAVVRAVATISACPDHGPKP